MQSNSSGLIIYTKIIKDNDLYIKILSTDDSILSGMVYGGNSSKKKLIYQPGYIIEFSRSQKNSNSIISIKGELTQPFITNIYSNKFKSFALLAIISLLNVSLYEDIKISGLYVSVKELITYINLNKNWLRKFCIWLFHLMKLLGYEIDYNNYANIKYFDLQSLNFQDIYMKESTVIFPHKLFKENGIIDYKSVMSIFLIFESVFIYSHLNTNIKQMPVNYLSFKKAILNKLNNK